MRTIWKREVQSYFYTPTGYIFAGVFLLISSVMFLLTILQQRSGDLPTFIGEMSYLWMLLSPVLTMKLLADEKQKKTDQLLLTSPVSLPGIVIGKYLAALTVMFATVALTFFFVLIVAVYGQVWFAELVVCYLGFILQGCAFIAMDLFISGCVSGPVPAAILSFGANFMVWMADILADTLQIEWIANALEFLSLYSRNEPFLMGQLSFASVIYDISFSAAFLALAVWMLDRHRYKGGANA